MRMQFTHRNLFYFVVVLAATFLSVSFNLRAEIIYHAKKGDSLTGIAKQHDISLSALAFRNGLRSSDQLIIGQRLIIPGANDEPKKR